MAVQQTSLHNLARLFRTARHLRLSQLYFRIVRVLRRRYERTALGRRRYQSRGVPPSDVVALRNPLQESRARRCLEEGGAYRFLNVTLETHGSWFPSGASDLWLFNLHYFDYVFEIKDDAVFQDLVLDWIERVPICHPLAWSPYALSNRICNWIWRHARAACSPAFERIFFGSIRSQLDYLEHHLEFDLLGNHLINNCKGLLVGNIFLSDPRGVKIGLDLLETQLKEQILLDGGHFERSPMYHLIVMEDLIAISFALLERDGVLPGFLSGVLEKMGGFLEGIISPCGIPLLNDTSCEVADSPQRVLEALPLVLPGYQSPRFVSGGVFYTESGLFIYQSPRLWFFFDVGPIGPDYQLGHAHNDMLSICLAFDGEPILTDSGVYEYRAGAWRDYFRSTAAHNTITVDGIDQNETWKSFRVGRRGYPSEVNYEPPARISAAHTGYKHIGVIHRREVELLENEQAVCVTDLIENRGAPREFESNLHFDPSIRLCTEAALTEESSEQVRSFEFETPKGSRFEVKVEGEGVRLSCGHSWYAPEFGLKQERLNLKIKGRALPGSTRCGFRIGRVRPLLSTT